MLPTTVLNDDTWAAVGAEIAPPTGDELHVWRIDLGAGDQQSSAVLSVDERERAARFCFERDRRRFTNGRAALRRILALYGRCEASAIEFAYSPEGKPSAPSVGVQFNVSHSGDVCVVGVRQSGRIGVDVEQVRPISDLAVLVRICLSPNERTILAGLPQDQQTVALLNGWTRKEAYLKAIGSGITAGLHAIEVTIAPGSSPRIIADASRSGTNPAEWTFLQVPLVAGQLGVVVVDGPIGRVRLVEMGSTQSD